MALEKAKDYLRPMMGNCTLEDGQIIKCMVGEEKSFRMENASWFIIKMGTGLMHWHLSNSTMSLHQ